jgi:hypothetical protein
MLRCSCSVASAVGVLASLLIPLTASASVTRLSAKDGTATAEFSSVDATGCVTTAVHVESAEVFLKDSTADPSKAASAGAYVTVSKIDTCAATESHFTGFTQNIMYRNDRRVTFTTVSGPITLCNDDSSGCYDTILDINWLGIGELLKYKSVDHQSSGGFRIVTHQQGDFRLTVALSGLLDAGAVNLTPNDATLSYITWADVHVVTINHGDFVDE